MSAVLAEREVMANAPVASGGSDYRARALAEGSEFLARVDAILPVLRAGRGQAEREGKVPARSVMAMAEAGVFRAFTPLQYGGLELSPADFFDALIRMAQADSAAAWIAGQITCQSLAGGYRVIERPVRYLPRVAGTASKLRAVQDGLRIMKMMTRQSIQLKPWRIGGCLILLIVLTAWLTGSGLLFIMAGVAVGLVMVLTMKPKA